MHSRDIKTGKKHFKDNLNDINIVVMISVNMIIIDVIKMIITELLSFFHEHFLFRISRKH